MAGEFLREVELELTAVLPPEIPHRERVISVGARHLAMVVETNRVMNLTRIQAPREAAIKHVLDSLSLWQRLEPFGKILDVGSGAGFPGIPLALAFPGKRFVLAESVGKKAAFLERCEMELGLDNVLVRAQRAEELRMKFDAVLVRAVAPIGDLLHTLRPIIRATGRLFLYKGPDVDAEMRAAEPLARRLGLKAKVSLCYDLPDGAGGRVIIEYWR